LVQALSADADGTSFLKTSGLVEEGQEEDDEVSWSVFVVLVAGVPGEFTDLLLQRLQTKYPTSAIIGGVCQVKYWK
jgi:hypothetical protein